MTVLVNDRHTYCPIPRDITTSIEKKIINNIDNLQVLGYLDIKDVYYLKSHNSYCPRIYGLPKVHKPNLPLRPILQYHALGVLHTLYPNTLVTSFMLLLIIKNTISKTRSAFKNLLFHKQYHRIMYCYHLMKCHQSLAYPYRQCWTILQADGNI